MARTPSFQVGNTGSIPAAYSKFNPNRKGEVDMSFQRVLKIATNKAYSGWDFNGDGMFEHDRVKGRDKRNRNKHQRTLEKRFTRKEINNIPL